MILRTSGGNFSKNIVAVGGVEGDGGAAAIRVIAETVFCFLRTMVLASMLLMLEASVRGKFETFMQVGAGPSAHSAAGSAYDLQMSEYPETARGRSMRSCEHIASRANVDGVQVNSLVNLGSPITNHKPRQLANSLPVASAELDSALPRIVVPT